MEKRCSILRFGSISAMAICLVSCTGRPIQSDPPGETLSDLPTSVRDAAQEAVPGILLTEMEIKGSGEGVFYEVEGHAEGKRYEIKIDTDGEVLDVELESKDEEMVSLSDVPRAVIESAKRELPGIELTSAELENHRSRKVYDLEGVLNGSRYELEITESGEVIEVENESDDDEDDND